MHLFHWLFLPSLLISTLPKGPFCPLFVFLPPSRPDSLCFSPASCTHLQSPMLPAPICARLPRRQTNQKHPSPASPLARRGTRSPSAFNEMWVLVHIMEAETEKPSGSLLQKQSLSTEVSSWELPGGEPITVNEGKFRQKFWQGWTDSRGKKWNVFTHPAMGGEGLSRADGAVRQPRLSNLTPDPGSLVSLCLKNAGLRASAGEVG